MSDISFTDEDRNEYLDVYLDAIPEDFDERRRTILLDGRPQLFDMLRRFEQGFPQVFWVGHGWIQLILDLDRKLRYLSPDYTISQIKEKFGGLRYYATYVPPIQLADIDDAPERSDIFYDLIDRAESRSFRICEYCGAFGSLRSDTSWYLTRCDQHYPDPQRKYAKVDE